MQPFQTPPADQQPGPDRPGTPPRPPYSPVTPVFAHLAPVPNTGAGPAHPIVPPAASPSPTTRVLSSFGTTEFSLPPMAAPPLPPPPPASAPVFAPQPAPVPISESENPDAIALRSAISILQLQKQQSLRDIQTLERLKKAAAADPEGFARELAAGNLSAADPGGFVNFTHDTHGDGDGDDADGEDKEGEGKAEKKAQGDGDGSRFGTIPTPQNVVRMPPINWAKYQVVGEPLDRMHEEQRRRPSTGEPRREDPTQRSPEHLLASPYRPLVDKLESPERVKRKQQK